MSKIFISDSISETALDLLRKSRVDFVYEPEISQSELTNKIGGCDALIVRSRTKVTKEILSHGSKLKVIGRAGVGLDNIDTQIAKELGIAVVNTPDALTNAVAEFTVALMLDLARKIPVANSALKEGKWIKNSLMGTELKGKVYGTIGIGRIGARVSELAYAFGMSIMANDVIPIPPSLIDKFDIRVSNQEEIFANADFVDLHVPLTKETTYLVNYQKLSLMKKSALIINTARGKVINEHDLIKALNEGKIAGAALDVFETEPLIQSELQQSEKVILTPHVAGQTDEAQTNAGRLVVEAVLEHLK